MNLIANIIKSSQSNDPVIYEFTSLIKTFYRKKYNLLTQERKDKIVGILTVASSKSKQVSSNFFKTWNEQVYFLGEERPLWATLLRDQIIDIVSDTEEKGPEEIYGLVYFAAMGGASGNSKGEADKSVEKIRRITLARPLTTKEMRKYRQTLDSSKSKGYPRIRRSLENIYESQM